MPKKVSELEKEAILKSFISGKDIKEIAKKYNYSPATITRQLKNLLNKDDYKDTNITVILYLNGYINTALFFSLSYKKHLPPQICF